MTLLQIFLYFLFIAGAISALFVVLGAINYQAASRQHARNMRDLQVLEDFDKPDIDRLSNKVHAEGIPNWTSLDTMNALTIIRQLKEIIETR